MEMKRNRMLVIVIVLVMLSGMLPTASNAVFANPPTEIDHVVIIETAPPAVDQAPHYGAALETAGVIILDVAWFEKNDQWELKDPSTLFEAKKEYKICVAVDTEPGYCFASDITATVNGEPATQIEPVAEGAGDSRNIFLQFPPLEDDMANARGGAPAFSPDDIAAINGIIEANPELDWTKADPADGSYTPDDWGGKVYWNDAKPRRATELYLKKEGLTGTLYVSGPTALQYLFCNDNNLDSLDLSNVPDLMGLTCSNNKLSFLNLDNMPELMDLRCDGNQLTELDVSVVPRLYYLNCSNNQLTWLDATGLVYLQELRCRDNQLTSLDVSGLTSLNRLYCEDNQLTGLDLSGLSRLWFLSCRRNQLSSIYTSDLTRLDEFYCDDNQLTGLDLSGLTCLTVLDCNNNKLSALDVKHLPVLSRLDCRNNQLSVLNLMHLPHLNRLNCRNNQLRTLNLKPVPTLYELHCSNNHLSSLDVSSMGLVILSCSNNQLTDLDFSDMTSLSSLYCDGNQLTSLDERYLSNVARLNCSNNHLSSLDVSGVVTMKELYCEDNQLTGLALNATAPYESISVRYNYIPNESAVTGRDILWDGTNYVFDPQYRRITYNANGGTGDMPKDTAIDGIQFVLPEHGFTAPAGKYFKTWAIGSLSGTHVDAGYSYTFTADTTVYAIWEYRYPVTVNNGTASPDMAAEGTTVTITAEDAPDGKKFDEWIVNSGNVTLADAYDATTTFTMPAEAVSLQAVFKNKLFDPGANKITQQPPAWTKGSNEPASFISDADFADFLYVKLDGEVVDRFNYDVKEGSTIVSFKPAFLETLSVGTHTVEIVSASGSAHGVLEIKALAAQQTEQVTKPREVTPKTGESGGHSPWPALMLLFAGGLLLMLRKIRSRQRD